MKQLAVPMLALLWPCLPAAYLASQNSPPQPSKTLPLEVELVRSLDSEKLQPGDEVLGKVRQDWSSGSCKLAAAAVIHGRVASLTKAADGRDHLALDFRLRCMGRDEQQKLIWIALLAPEPIDDSNRVLQQSLKSASFGKADGTRPDGNEGTSRNRDMSGRQNPSFPIFVETEDDRKAKRPSSVKTGDVFQLPRLKLDVGAGPEDSTVLSSKDKRLKLPMGSILVLLTESAAIQTAAVDTPVRKAAVQTRAVRKLPPEIASCAEPTCTVLASMAAANATSATPFKTISLDRLGYHRLKAAEMHELEFSTAIAFLGEHRVLFTFDPHTLVKREPGDRPGDRPHMVRAVLLNVATGETERTLEWRVRNGAQYLWTIDGEHVVIHDGDRLRWFGDDLREEREHLLDGPLAFFRMSPDRNHYAIGTIRELHTSDEHATLSKADAAGPEEQIRVDLLDANLKVEDAGLTSSRILPPVLLNEGRLELRRAHGNSFYLREYGWTPGGEPRDFGRMESTCVPTVESMSANILIAEGCDRNPNDHWLLVFGKAGAPILKSTVRWREFSPLTVDTGEGAMFAMAICEGSGEYVRSSAFHGKDLYRETVRIHRVSDGREIFSTRMRFPLPSNQPISFSPSGKQIAIVDGDRVDLYSIHAAEPLVAQNAQR